MRKIGFALYLVLSLVLIVYYWFSFHPKSYNYNTAVNNNDVVMGAAGIVNKEKFHDFIKLVEKKQTGKIHIVAYSKEGYPIIFDLDFDGKIIKCS